MYKIKITYTSDTIALMHNFYAHYITSYEATRQHRADAIHLIILLEKVKTSPLQPQKERRKSYYYHDALVLAKLINHIAKNTTLGTYENTIIQSMLNTIHKQMATIETHTNEHHTKN